MVHVDDEDGDNDRECDKYHDEEQVLSDERDDLGGGGDDFLYDKQEHSEGHQDRCGERELLAFVRGQVEHQHREEGQTQAGDDEEEGVEQRQSLQDERIGEKGVRIHAVLPVAFGPRGAQDLPLAVVKEVFAVHLLVDQDQVHHVAVVCPRAKLHGAVLPVEGEEGDVHGTGGLVACRRRPGDGAVVPHNGFGHQ